VTPPQRINALQEITMDTMICYCFEYTAGDIRRDVLDNGGTSRIMHEIIEARRMGTCQCHIKHPEGT